MHNRVHINRKPPLYCPISTLIVDSEMSGWSLNVNEGDCGTLIINNYAFNKNDLKKFANYLLEMCDA